MYLMFLFSRVNSKQISSKGAITLCSPTSWFLPYDWFPTSWFSWAFSFIPSGTCIGITSSIHTYCLWYQPWRSVPDLTCATYKLLPNQYCQWALSTSSSTLVLLQAYRKQRSVVPILYCRLSTFGRCFSKR